MLCLNCCSLPPQPSPWALPAEGPEPRALRSPHSAPTPCAAPAAEVQQMSEASAGSVPTVATAEADKLPETADRSLLTELYSRPNSRLLDICQVTGRLDIQHCPLWHSGAGISRDPNYHTLGSPAVQLTAKRCHLVFGFRSVHRMFKTRVATRNPRLLLFSCAFIRIFLSFRNQVHNFEWFPYALLLC